MAQRDTKLLVRVVRVVIDIGQNKKIRQLLLSLFYHILRGDARRKSLDIDPSTLLRTGHRSLTIKLGFWG